MFLNLLCFTAGDIEFPTDEEKLDDDVEVLIKYLLQKDPKNRLGAGGEKLFVCLTNHSSLQKLPL